MRAALAQVKETLGADAVIMSNKKVTGGIEIVAAVDYDSPKPATAPTASPFMELGEDKVSLGSGHVRSIVRPTRSLLPILCKLCLSGNRAV